MGMMEGIQIVQAIEFNLEKATLSEKEIMSGLPDQISKIKRSRYLRVMTMG